MLTKTVTVTADHVRRGKPQDPMRCALALAFGDAGYKKACIYIDLSDDHDNDEEARVYFRGGCIRLDRSVLAKIKHFDETGEMEPFTLTVPDHNTKE